MAQIGSVITEQGRNLIAKLHTNNLPLVINRAAVGSGELPDGVVLDQITGLYGYVMDAVISGYNNPQMGQATIMADVLSPNVNTAFMITEVALFAFDPDIGEILYAYVPMQSSPESMKDKNDPVGKLLSLEITILMAGIAELEVTISPNALIHRDELDMILGRYALVEHTHAIADIIGLAEALLSINTKITALQGLKPSDIGAAVATKQIAKTLSATWSSGSQVISDASITSASTIGSLHISNAATAAQFLAYINALLQTTAQAAGSMTVTARGTVPAIAIPVILEIRG